MTTLIPTRDAFVAGKMPGEQRPGERLEQTSVDLRLNALQRSGQVWGEVAVLSPDYRSPGDFDPSSDKIKVMTMHVSKGLEFPVVETQATQRLGT
jgi:superfamily I DNA/RNA helicase